VIASGVSSACATVADTEPEHTCAVMDSGELRCWGSNQHGALGEGDSGERTSPATTLAAGVRQVACGSRHTCAVMDDGSVRCWGSSVDGATAGSNTQSPVNLGL
jgi:alpha-tubulin suppressor-like RCC1 family protein